MRLSKDTASRWAMRSTNLTIIVRCPGWNLWKNAVGEFMWIVSPQKKKEA